MNRWPTKPLGELCDVRIGRTPRRDNPRFWGGNAVWVTIRELNGGEIISSKEMISEVAVRECMPDPVPVGTLLFSFKLSIGKMAIAGCSLYTNEAIAALPIHDPSNLSRDFLRYALLAESHEGIANTAVLGKVLNKEKVQQLLIPVPPLPEQERIVKLLDEADALRKLRSQADRRASDLIPALFHEMFNNTGTRSWETHYFGTPEIMEIIDGDRGNKYPKKTDFHEMDYCLFLNTSNVRKGFFDFSKCDFISREKDAELRNGKLLRDDVVLTTRGTLGNSAHFNHDVKYEAVRINSGMVILRVNPDFLSPEYLLAVLNSNAFKNQIITMTSGSAQPQLPINKLTKIKFILPPLPLQKEFAERVAEIRAMEAAQAESRKKLDALFQSLLHRAFAGEI